MTIWLEFFSDVLFHKQIRTNWYLSNICAYVVNWLLGLSHYSLTFPNHNYNFFFSFFLFFSFFFYCFTSKILLPLPPPTIVMVVHSKRYLSWLLNISFIHITMHCKRSSIKIFWSNTCSDLPFGLLEIIIKNIFLTTIVMKLDKVYLTINKYLCGFCWSAGDWEL